MAIHREYAPAFPPLMLDRPNRSNTTDRALVTVTFLRINRRPDRPPPPAPPGVNLAPARLRLDDYRALYNSIGGPWLWWLRRVMPDDLLARHLKSPTLAIHLLRLNGELAGFYETDASTWPDVNLNYFGLRLGMIGRGLGHYMLATAIHDVFSAAAGLRGMTVNTCTADHPRALPNYLAAGFFEIRQAREEWDIPRRLGLTIPEHLRG